MNAITPKPDMVNSRYPYAFCLTCGGGWKAFVQCEAKAWVASNGDVRACDFTGEVDAQGNVVYPESSPPVSVGNFDWSKATPPK